MFNTDICIYIYTCACGPPCRGSPPAPSCRPGRGRGRGRGWSSAASAVDQAHVYISTLGTNLLSVFGEAGHIPRHISHVMLYSDG